MVRGLLVMLLAGSLEPSCPAAPRRRKTAPADTEHGRFSFHKVDEGFLRLDTRTGQVSLCNHKNLGWACDTIPDERAALENEIARLQTGNAALKKDMLARGLSAARPGQAGAAARQGHDDPS